MVQFKFNEFYPQAYDNFVPLAEKKNNGKLFKIIVGVAVVSLLVYWITRPNSNKTQEEDND
jgi:hypothetical protein